MSRKRYTQEQILKISKGIEEGASSASVGRAHGIGVQTMYEWRRRYAGKGKSELAELKALQEENRRLKAIVANMGARHRGLQGASEGKVVSLASRRRTVAFLLGRGYPRVRSCRVVGLSRAASRHERRGRRPEVRAKVLELAKENPRYGFRRVHALLEGVHLKAVHRIWKAEGLSLRHRPRRRLCMPKVEASELTGPNQVWCLDFSFQRLENGRHARILGVPDCFTREVPAPEGRFQLPLISCREGTGVAVPRARKAAGHRLRQRPR